MRQAWLLVAALMLAGCADDGTPAEQAEPTPVAPYVAPAPEPALAHPLGINDTTPVVELRPGSWQVTFQASGAKQFILRLADTMAPNGYSISGRFVLALVPIDFVFGACDESKVNLLVTGSGGFSATWNQDVPPGDYLAVALYGEGAEASFTWQVGDDPAEQTLDAKGESSAWTLATVEPTFAGQAFTVDVPAGLQFLTLRASSGLLAQSSSARMQVADPGVCAEAVGEAGLQPTGGSLSLVLHTQSGAPVAWSGEHQRQNLAAVDEPSASAVGSVLVPPGLASA